MKDVLGNEVKTGDVIVVTASGWNSAYTTLAVVSNEKTAAIKRRIVPQKRIWDEPVGYTQKGELNADGVFSNKPIDGANYWTDRTYRKYHMEPQTAALGGATVLGLGFSRAAIINIDQIQDAETRDFFRKAHYELRGE